MTVEPVTIVEPAHPDTRMDRDELVQAILELAEDQDGQLRDRGLAEELAAHVKPHVDEWAAARRGASTGGGRRRRTKKGADPPEGPVPDVMSLPPAEQARWIFMERYISLEKHEDILGLSFQPEAFAEHQDSFDRLIKDLLLLPPSLEAAEKNDIAGLQKVFARCVPVFRYPQLGDESGDTVDSTVETLRQAFPSYFYRRRKKPNWFESREFYREPVPGPRWVLCDTESLNCTLRRPDRRLAAYATSWDLPPDYAHQKRLVEDIYDRIVVGEALGEDLFAGNTNNLTATKYRVKKGQRLVFTVQKVHKITLHGKSGIPHWRAMRRLWPGVHPTLAFPEASSGGS